MPLHPASWLVEEKQVGSSPGTAWRGCWSAQAQSQSRLLHWLCCPWARGIGWSLPLYIFLELGLWADCFEISKLDLNVPWHWVYFLLEMSLFCIKGYLRTRGTDNADLTFDKLCSCPPLTVKASVILLSRKLFILAMGMVLVSVSRVWRTTWASGRLDMGRWSRTEVLCTFWLRNVLRATTACAFSTSQLPKVVRTWCALCILTSKCASRHNGVHFFDISTSKSAPTMVFCTFWLANVLRATTACNFSSLIWPAGSASAALASLLFDPPEPQIIGKTQCFSVSRLSDLFSHLHLLSSYSFSSTLLSSNLSLLSASSLLSFSSVHIVGSLTSKLPSIITVYIYIYI